MKCSNCGRILTGEENFCRICGNKIEKKDDKIVESFTDNIDVTKVEIPSRILDDDSNNKIKNNTGELDAMLEIVNSLQKKEEEPPITIVQNNIMFDNHLDDESNNDIIQNTQDLLLNSVEEDNDSFLSEPTIMVPNDLISNYSKHNTTDTKEVYFEQKEIEKKEPEEVKTIELTNQDETKTSYEKNDDSVINNSIDSKPELKVENKVADLNEKVKIIYKNRRSTGAILLAILFTISLFSIGYLTYLLLSSYNIIQSVNNNNIKLEDEITELKEKNNDFEFELNNKRNENNNKVFKYNKYLFKSLEGYDYSIANDLLSIKNNNISLDINIDDSIKYSNIKEEIDKYSESFNEKGYTVTSHGIKVEDQREYVYYLIASSDNKNSLVVYSMIDDNNTIGIMINSDNVGLNYDDLKVTNSIIESISVDTTYEEKNISLFEEKGAN